MDPGPALTSTWGRRRLSQRATRMKDGGGRSAQLVRSKISTSRYALSIGIYIFLGLIEILM